MTMFWLCPKESIVIGRNCVLSLSNVSAAEVRLCVTVPGNLRICWPEFDSQALVEVSMKPVAVVTVLDVRHRRVCLGIEGPPEATFQQLEAYAAEHGDKVPHFSEAKSVFIDRKKNEYVFIELQ